MTRWPRVAIPVAIALASLAHWEPGATGAGAHRAPGGPATGCVTCHVGIEEMHPWFALSCVDCHGGDGTAVDKGKAHVAATLPRPGDERVLPLDHDLAYARFVNPGDLRVAQAVCGDCHGDLVRHLEKSLHATTTGHLGDGYYEHGLAKDKRPSFSIFPVRDERAVLPPHALRATVQVPPFRRGDPGAIATHFTDLPRKACMQCHLWSVGRALRGRLGMDGDYRGQGCAACHVTYADDGRSRSADPTIRKDEPGHPREHRLTSRIPTDTCTRCHYGDASIGLHFRGLAQLVPGQPAGPEVPGTTAKLLNGVFYVQDQDLTPPDVHHERGLHCIDCHTLRDTMGDGNLYPNMDHAVEIECTSCHGTIQRESTLTTAKGRRVTNLQRDGERFVLVSKVTGKRHPVKQARHVVTPGHPDYNARAAAAMTEQHARLECYTCHNGWNVNFFGFHFDRNEQFTQLDLLSGERTPGRVTTQEKVFATFNQLRLGFNHEGMVAPYLVGFSTIGSAHDAKGREILRQAAPQTQAGLSGVTQVPHQMHTTRPEARGCVECHRSPTTYGLGSANFRLARENAYALTPDRFLTVGLDAKTPARSAPLGATPVEGDARALALRPDPVHGHATHAYVGSADGSLTVLALDNPAFPRVLARRKVLHDPRRLLVQGPHLYVADGVAGVKVFDLSRPESPRLVGQLPTAQAHAVALAFPWLVIADGPGGLVVADVSDPSRPRAIGNAFANPGTGTESEILDVTVFFQYSRTARRGARLQRTPARLLAFAAAGLDGVRIFDLSEPAQPAPFLGQATRAFRFNRGDVRGVAVHTVFDLGTPGGGLRSQERDYLYVYVHEGADQDRQHYVRVFDVSDPARPQGTRGNTRVYGGTGRLLPLCVYNAPFLQHFVLAPGAGGLATLVDVSRVPAGTSVAATLQGAQGIRDLAFEEFAFDRLQDESGRWWKDISHEGCRYLDRDEMLRVLRAPLGTAAPRTLEPLPRGNPPGERR
ncbi:MAG: hypothetical protein IT458_06280 [Planctomycetes bacterium]|nr:hypothetical protein [Planctomycetota bacterium]